MAAPIRPAGIKVNGKEKWVFVPAVADKNAPKLTEVNAATGFDLSGVLYKESFDGVSADTARVTSPARLLDTESYESLGNTTLSLSDLLYMVDPQGAAASDGKKALEKLPDGTTGFLIRRMGINASTDFALGQFVDVIPVTVGPPIPTKTGTDDGAEVAIRQAVAISDKPAFLKALVA